MEEAPRIEKVAEGLRLLHSPEIELRMHDREWEAVIKTCPTQPLVSGNQSLVSKKHDVLPKPQQGALVQPDLAADEVDGSITVSLEFRRPIREEPFIHVMIAALKGYGSREQHGGRATDERCDAIVRRGFRLMFGDLPSDSEIGL